MIVKLPPPRIPDIGLDALSFSDATRRPRPHRRVHDRRASPSEASLSHTVLLREPSGLERDRDGVSVRAAVEPSRGLRFHRK